MEANIQTDPDSQSEFFRTWKYFLWEGNSQTHERKLWIPRSVQLPPKTAHTEGLANVDCMWPSVEGHQSTHRWAAFCKKGHQSRSLDSSFLPGGRWRLGGGGNTCNHTPQSQTLETKFPVLRNSHYKDMITCHHTFCWYLQLSPSTFIFHRAQHFSANRPPNNHQLDNDLKISYVSTAKEMTVGFPEWTGIYILIYSQARNVVGRACYLKICSEKLT